MIAKKPLVTGQEWLCGEGHLRGCQGVTMKVISYKCALELFIKFDIHVLCTLLYVRSIH